MNIAERLKDSAFARDREQANEIVEQLIVRAGIASRSGYIEMPFKIGNFEYNEKSKSKALYQLVRSELEASGFRVEQRYWEGERPHLICWGTKPNE
jgi:TPP-dependent 2-oxoacid decarboxylase